MFTQPYFPGHAFAPRYFPHGGLAILVVLGVPGVFNDFVSRMTASDAVVRAGAGDRAVNRGSADAVDLDGFSKDGGRMGGVG